MSYQPAVAGEKDGKTTVKNSDGTSTVYHFSKNLLATLIQYFGLDGSLKKEKIFTWNDKNWLTSVELRDGNKHLLLRKSYEYDGYGNPITELLTGDLQGVGTVDNYSIKREFSQDGRNLLLKEETEEGKTTLFEYLPNTNLVTLKLTKERDRILLRESVHYDDCHNVIRKSVGDGNGQMRMIDYILRSQQPLLHMPEWIEEKYLDNGVEKLLKRTQLLYDQWGNVKEERIHDADGLYVYSIFKEYNERGDVLSETNPLGHRRTFAYDSKGRCIASTPFSQKLKEEMRYDTKGRLLEKKEISDDEVHETRYSYDSTDHLIRKVDEYQNSTSYSYDHLVHKITKSEFPTRQTGDGEVSTVATHSTYDVLGRELSKKDANGNLTSYRYNAYGLPIEITYPNGSKEIFRYSTNGKIKSYTNKDGLTTHYTFDILGRVTSKIYEGIGKESYAYDSLNLIASIDLEGHTTNYTYDGAQRKIREEICGRVTEYMYDSLGRLETTKKDTLLTHFKRDLEDRIIEESKTDPTGILLYRIGYSYTPAGELESMTRHIQGKDAVEQFTYDAFGREIAHQDPLGNKTSTVYDEHYLNSIGQTVLQITTMDPEGTTTVVTQDPFFQAVKEETLDPKGAVIAGWDKIYDPNGNVLLWKEHVYEDGQYKNTQCTRFTYTSDNKIESSTRAFGTHDSRTLYYTYTPNGQVATKTLADGVALSYSYDLLGFLRHLCSSDGQINHRFECTKNGELTDAFDDVEKISIHREVDPFGNVTRELFPNSIEIRKAYDPLDRLTTLQINGMGSISYEYDPVYLRKVSRLSQDGKLQYSHHYDGFDLDGNLLSEQLIYECGSTKHTLDLKGRKTELSSPYFSQKCLYDACDNLIQDTKDRNKNTYTYDHLSQLTLENEITYRYDSLFNRVEKDNKHIKINDLNESLDQIYDPNGNLIQKDNTHYTYDHLNRLTEASVGSKRIRFLYDPLGRRLAKSVLNPTSSGWNETDREYYIYNGQQEIGAIAADGTLKNLRVLGLNTHEKLQSTVAIEMNRKAYATIMDVQNNICRLVDPLSKKIVSKYEFTAFGEETSGQNDENPWRWAAKRFDPELNLIYFGKRYYDPESSRWLTTDPAGFADSLNLYQYAFNNPYSYYDPNGEFVWALALPFAYFFGPAIAKACLDALIIGVVSWGVYEGTKYAADYMGSRYTLSEDFCYDLISTDSDNRRDSTKMDRNKKKSRDKNYPGDAKDLEKNPDWRETTHPENRSGSRDFENKKTGEKIRYDKGKPGKPGHEGRDHHHRYNPNSKGDNDKYLDKDGKPCGKGSDESHLYPPEGNNWA
jgi:RHS repeat-associated protein